MIKKWIVRPIRGKWKRFTEWLFSWQKKDE